jgi:hypothetical protein
MKPLDINKTRRAINYAAEKRHRVRRNPGVCEHRFPSFGASDYGYKVL